MDDSDSSPRATVVDLRPENDLQAVGPLDRRVIALQRCSEKTSARQRSIRSGLWPRIAGNSCRENEITTKEWQDDSAFAASTKNKHLTREAQLVAVRKDRGQTFYERHLEQDDCAGAEPQLAGDQHPHAAGCVQHQHNRLVQYV